MFFNFSYFSNDSHKKNVAWIQNKINRWHVGDFKVFNKYSNVKIG